MYICSLQALKDDFDNHNRAFEHVMEEGKNFLDNMKPGREKDKLERNLEVLEERWKKLAERLEDRQEKLEEIEPNSEQYYNSCQGFTVWLDDAEKRLKDMEKLPCDAEELQQAHYLLEVSLSFFSCKTFFQTSPSQMKINIEVMV